METVEVIIRLSKDEYEKIKETNTIKEHLNKIDWAVRNGIVLPKGHGRLFILDEEVAKKYLTKFSFSLQDWISEVGISEATLKMIEADKDGK